MGFRLPAQIHFDSVILSDESVERKLLIDLADRDIISNETLLERFGELPTIEKVRVSREDRNRQADKAPDKASPYHNPNHKKDLEKMDKQGNINMKLKKQDQKNKPKQPEQLNVKEAGRPDGAIDQDPRKKRRVNPRTSASEILWAMEAQDKISEIINPIMLSHFDKSDFRSLTKDEVKNIDSLKNIIFANLEIGQKINNTSINSIVNSRNSIPLEFSEHVESGIADFMENNSRGPNINEMKVIKASAFIHMAKN